MHDHARIHHQNRSKTAAEAVLLLRPCLFIFLEDGPVMIPLLQGVATSDDGSNHIILTWEADDPR